MTKYLDNLGLTYLWSKIKGFFLSKVAFNTSRKGENLYAETNEVSGYIDGSGTIATPSATAKEVTSDWIPVAGASTFTVQTWLIESRSMWLAYMFYSDKDLSTKIGSRPSKSANATYLSYDNVSIPTEANYVRVSYRTFGIGRCKVEIDGKTEWNKSLPDIQDYGDRLQYNNLVWVNAALAAKSLAANRTGMGYEPLVTGYSYDIAFPILYAPNAVDASTEWSGGYLAYPNISIASLGINVETMQYGQVLWLKGTLNGIAFTLAPEPFVTMVKPTSEDGYLYMPIGWTKNENIFWFQQTYQFYAFKNGAFRPIETVSGGGGSGTVLFNNDSQPMNTYVTLNQSAFNFARLLIICKDNDNIYTSVQVEPALNKKFSVMTVYPGSNGFWIKAKTFEFRSDVKIDTAHGGVDYMRGEINAAGSNATDPVDHIGIVKVIGYNY